MLEKKTGKKEVNNVISTIRRDELSKKAFPKHVSDLGVAKEICRSLLQISLAEYMFEGKTVLTRNRRFRSKYMSEI